MKLHEHFNHQPDRRKTKPWQHHRILQTKRQRMSALPIKARAHLNSLSHERLQRSIKSYTKWTTLKQDKRVLYLDSGATHHYLHPHLFDLFADKIDTCDLKVETASGQTLRATQTGRIKLPIAGTKHELILRGARRVPGISENLIAPRLLANDGIFMEIKPYQAVLKHKGSVLIKAPCIEGMYPLVIHNKQLQEWERVVLLPNQRRTIAHDTERGNANIARAYKGSLTPTELMHKKLAHSYIYSGPLYNMIKEELGITPKQQRMCVDCAATKLHKFPHPRDNPDRRVPRNPGEFIHLDSIEMPVRTLKQHHTWLTTIYDECAASIEVVTSHGKKHSDESVIKKLEQMQRDNEYKVKLIRTDGGTEFFGVKDWCEKNGVRFETSCPYTQEQNGRAENTNKIVLQGGEACRVGAGLPRCYWGLAYKYFAYTYRFLPNKAVSSHSHFRTPQERLRGKHLDWKQIIKWLHPFGCLCYHFVPRELREHTHLAPKGLPCIFLGYAENKKGYVVELLNTGKIIYGSYNVSFDEEVFPVLKPQKDVLKLFGEEFTEKMLQHRQDDIEALGQENSSSMWGQLAAKGKDAFPMSHTCSPQSTSLTKMPKNNQGRKTEASSRDTHEDLKTKLGGTNDDNLPQSHAHERKMDPQQEPRQKEGKLRVKNNSLSGHTSRARTKTSTATGNTGGNEATNGNRDNTEKLLESLLDGTTEKGGDLKIRKREEIVLPPTVITQGPTMGKRYPARSRNLSQAGWKHFATRGVKVREAARTVRTKTTKTTKKKKLSGSKQSLPHGINDEMIREAEQAFLDKVSKYNIFALVPKPRRGNIMKGRWVYDFSIPAFGIPSKLRARWVCKGFSQKKYVDYNQTACPVLRMDSYRILEVLALKLKLTERAQVDVEGAFYNSKPKFTQFMEQPKGWAMKGREQHVWQLLKSLPGAKDAAHNWHEDFSNYLTQLGFNQLKSDRCVYVYPNTHTTNNNNHKLIVGVHVDDMCVWANNKHALHTFFDKLKKRFALKIAPEMNRYVGICSRTHSTANRTTIQLSAPHYIHKTADILAVSKGDSRVPTPDLQAAYGKFTNEHCVPPGDPRRAELNKLPYREAIATLAYAARACRPDIAATVAKLQRHCHNFGTHHYKRLQRLCRYCLWTDERALTLGVLNNVPLLAYADADWSGCPRTFKSHAGYVIKVFGSTVEWYSRKIDAITLSSAQAETEAAVEAGKSIEHTRNLMLEIALHLDEQELMKTLFSVIPILEDNTAVISGVAKPNIQNKTRHYNVKLHYLKDLYNSGTAVLHYIHTDKQQADMFTKTQANYPTISASVMSGDCATSEEQETRNAQRAWKRGHPQGPSMKLRRSTVAYDLNQGVNTGRSTGNYYERVCCVTEGEKCGEGCASESECVSKQRAHTHTHTHTHPHTHTHTHTHKDTQGCKQMLRVSMHICAPNKKVKGVNVEKM